MFGTVATIRDRTEIESLGSELETMRTLSDALRAQTHEHANRLHTMVSLLELGRTGEALDFATKDLELSQQLTDDMVGSVRSPCSSALIMGKAAEAHERGVELAVKASAANGRDRPGRPGPRHHPWQPAGQRHRCRRRRPGPEAGGTDGGDRRRRAGDHCARIPDKGIDPDAVDDIFRYGFSTKEAGPFGRGLGLALVKQAVQRLGGTMTITNSGGTGGARFHIALPAPDPHSLPEEQA